jgi:hypothetical protein
MTSGTDLYLKRPVLSGRQNYLADVLALFCIGLRLAGLREPFTVQRPFVFGQRPLNSRMSEACLAHSVVGYPGQSV